MTFRTFEYFFPVSDFTCTDMSYNIWLMGKNLSTCVALKLVYTLLKMEAQDIYISSSADTFDSAI